MPCCLLKPFPAAPGDPPRDRARELRLRDKAGILQDADIRPAGHVFTFDRELFQKGGMAVQNSQPLGSDAGFFWLPA